VPEGKGIPVRVGGREIALFRLGDEVFAVEDRCPHQYAELHTGTLSADGTLTCAWHGWRFPLADRAASPMLPGMPCPERFPVKVEDGRVYVRVAPARRDPQAPCP
jgi:nitrite reductase/ring-hydroxylating ferredoxin subunit